MFGLQDVLLFLCVFLCTWIVYLDFRNRKFNLPPGPFGLPFIGYLIFLHKHPHLELAKLCKKYGNIMSLYLGRRYAVVLADYTSIKEAYSQISSTDKAEGQFHFVPNGLGFNDINGIEWIEQRRFALRKLRDLGLGKSAWENELHIEIGNFLNFLGNSNGEPVDYDKQLLANLGNNILRLILGYPIPVNDPRRKVIERAVDSFVKNFSKASFISLLPNYAEFLKKIGFNAVDDEMLKDMKALNRLVREEVKNHRQSHEKSCEESYIDGYLKEIKNKEEKKLNNSFNDELLIGNIQVFLFAGSLTMKVSLTWLFLAMASYPDIQRKIHDEIDFVLGRDGKPQWTDHTKFPYTFATIMEGQRWRTLAPIIPTHRTNADMRVGTYVIPKNVDIMALSWDVHNDPKNWPDPKRFMPERFLTKDKQLILNPENYLPFSTGKRMCPGQNVAYIEIFCFFTSVMQQYEILPAVAGQPPCLEGTLGVFYRPDPHQLCFIPRA